MLRATLLKLSESPRFAQWVTSNGTTRRMARRFVAGETLDEAVEAARACNNAGMLASLDYLGEAARPQRMPSAPAMPTWKSSSASRRKISTPMFPAS